MRDPVLAMRVLLCLAFNRVWRGRVAKRKIVDRMPLLEALEHVIGADFATSVEWMEGAGLQPEDFQGAWGAEWILLSGSGVW